MLNTFLPLEVELKNMNYSHSRTKVTKIDVNVEVGVESRVVKSGKKNCWQQSKILQKFTVKHNFWRTHFSM